MTNYAVRETLIDPSLRLPRERVLTEDVLSYSRCGNAALSALEIAELSLQIERFCSDRSSLGAHDCQDVVGRHRAQQPLELTISEGFISVTEDGNRCAGFE